MSWRCARSFRLCSEPTAFLKTVTRCTRKENALYAARLEHLSASFKPGTEAVRFYLLSDRKEHSAALGFFGRFGILVAESGFSSADLSSLLSLLTQAGDSIISAEADGLRGIWKFLPRWRFEKGDSLVLPKPNHQVPQISKDFSLFVCSPTYQDIQDFFELFASGFPSFARRNFDSFYLEENHMIRHNTAKLFGFRCEERLVCGGGVELGSPHLRYLFDLTTVSPYRHRGLAANLIAQIALEDPRPLCLSTREASLSIYYRKLGFVPIGKWIQITRQAPYFS